MRRGIRASGYRCDALNGCGDNSMAFLYGLPLSEAEGGVLRMLDLAHGCLTGLGVQPIHVLCPRFCDTIRTDSRHTNPYQYVTLASK